jgi:hypothetical protein
MGKKKWPGNRVSTWPARKRNGKWKNISNEFLKNEKWIMNSPPHYNTPETEPVDDNPTPKNLPPASVKEILCSSGSVRIARSQPGKELGSRPVETLRSPTVGGFWDSG